MTTTVKISNKANSNGDVHIRAIQPWNSGENRLSPGQSTEWGITDSSVLTVFETMPSTGSSEGRTAAYYGALADELIAVEIARLFAGPRSSLPDQLMRAGIAQLDALLLRHDGVENAFSGPPAVYPKDWSGFRDYGSDIANLVVAIAFLRQEVKRKLSIGEDSTRLTG